MQDIRVGIIGTGFGRVHAATFQALDGVSVVAITGRDLEKTRSIANLYSIENCFTNFRTMLDDVELDLICIASPPAEHAEMAMEVMARGKHMLLEKPVSVNILQSREIIQRADNTKSICALSYEFRYAESRQILKEYLASHQMGSLIMVSASEFSCMLNDPTAKYNQWVFSDALGGSLRGSHTLDAIVDLVGPIRSTVSKTGTFVPVRYREGERVLSDAQDAGVALFEFESGVLGSFSYSPVVSHGCRLLEFRGSKGTLTLDNENRILFSPIGKEAKVVWDDSEIASSETKVSGDHVLIERCFRKLAQAIVHSIRGNITDFPKLADSLHVEEILHSIHRSRTVCQDVTNPPETKSH